MSLSTNVSNLAVATATELKKTRTLVNGNAADLTALTTAQKTDLVAALNWLHAELQTVAGGAAGINDAGTSTNTTWSSTKTSTEIAAAVNALVDGAPGALDTIRELAEALTGQTGAVAAIETALANRVRYDAEQTLTAPQQAQARGNIGAGTSSLAIGTTASTAKAGNWVPSSTDISDASATGRSLLTAASQTAARTAIGAGTSNLAIGTTAATAKAGNYVPTWGEVSAKPATFAPTAHDHPAAQISDATTTGRAVLTAANAAAARDAIGAGTGSSNLALGTTSSTAKAGDYQPTAANISDATVIGRAVLTAATTAAARTAIGAGTSSLALGTTASAAKAGNWVPAAADISDASATGRTLLTASSAAAALSAIGGIASSAVGDTNVDYAAQFMAALA